jgi:hypothetical protein
MLVKVRVDRALNQRFGTQGAARALGFRAPIEKAPDLLKQCLSPEFDAVMVPVPWQAVEPQQGRFHWEQLDRWVVWAKSTKRAIMIGPLLDLRPGGIPGWVLPSLKDLPKFEQHLYRFVREVVIRYAPVDPTWHVAAGVNSCARRWWRCGRSSRRHGSWSRRRIRSGSDRRPTTARSAPYRSFAC